METTGNDFKVYDAMQEAKPLRRYIKTVLGKVYVTVLNPFSGKPEGVILQGDPRDPNKQDDITINVWTVKEDMFFQKMNKAHFLSGNLRELKQAEVVVAVESENEISEEEIVDLLNKPFLALKNRLEKFTAVAPVYRLLTKAEELEKSQKILDAIKARLAELELEA